MDRLLRETAERIIAASIQAVQPDEAVKRALKGRRFTGRIRLVAVGKAAWQMAKSAYEELGDRIESGVVVTKYHHVKGPIGAFICCEGGHPVPDENSFIGTQKALDNVRGLTEKDTVLFLLSGGGSALFEKSLLDKKELQDITNRLLKCGASIIEINTIRKRLSAVKGGRFAQFCAPAKVFSVVLSDIVGDPLDMIASGPACPDTSTCADALAVVQKYQLPVSEQTLHLLQQETPKKLDNVTTQITGSVRQLCRAAARACEKEGYRPFILTEYLQCEAKEAGLFLASMIKTHTGTREKLAFLAGGETVVHLTGTGKGGRNQELVLAAAAEISGIPKAALFSIGSDGTDGPTDAAGGYVDGTSYEALCRKNINPYQVLQQNDAYHALSAIGGLIITGPTGTNVNDVAVALIG